jgi:LPXTG-site transpeptidase (sortase) family protein
MSLPSGPQSHRAARLRSAIKVISAVAIAAALGIGGWAVLRGASGEAGTVPTPGNGVIIGSPSVISTPAAPPASDLRPDRTTPAGSPTPGAAQGSAGATIGVVARRIRIERLGIDIPVVEGDGVDAPLGKAAHYPGTAWPNGGSNIYLYGHARKGSFLALWEARLGDVVVLDLADGSQQSYVVSKILPRAPWNDLDLLKPTASEQLTLQTCTSNRKTAPRFVVIAVPAP